MTVQVSFATQGGSDTPVPDLSIEVDDIEVALRRVSKAGLPVGPLRLSFGSNFLGNSWGEVWVAAPGPRSPDRARLVSGRYHPYFSGVATNILRHCSEQRLD